MPLDLHTSENMFVWYLKEHLLKRKQTPAYVSNLAKKSATKGKIEPLGSQRAGHESKHPRVTWLRHLIMPSKMGKWWFQHVSCIEKNRMIILLETNDKCMGDQYPKPQECRANNPNHQKKNWTCPKKQEKWLDDKLGDQ